MQLRNYQRAAIDAIYDYYHNGGNGNVLISAPTGSGKALMIAKFAQEVLRDHPHVRIIQCVHVHELISQNLKHLLQIWPDAPAGVYSAGLGRKDTDASILFAGIQSVYNKVDVIGASDIIIVDECHLIPRNSNTRYRKFFDTCHKANESVKIIGFSASPFRLDSGYLHKGDGAIFDDLIYDIPIMDLVDDGYLAPLTSKYPKTQLDASGVKIQAGDYAIGDLAKAVDKQDLTEGAVAEAVEYGHDRKGWLFFGVNVDHCQNIEQALRRHGVAVASVFGSTPKQERADIIARFRAQELRALVSCEVLGTGFDAPHVDLLAMMRPTKSPVVYLQQAGRAMRPYPGKPNGLVLDFASNIFTHGPIDEIKPREKGKRDVPGEAPVKPCPNCRTIVPAAIRVCPECAWCFPPPDPRIAEKASYLRIMNGSMKPETFSVDGVRFVSSGYYGLRVIYTCDGNKFTKHINPEARDYRLSHYKKWWEQHGLNEPPPTKCKDLMAMADQMPVPSKVLVRRKPNKKGFVVMKCEFGDRV